MVSAGRWVIALLIGSVSMASLGCGEPAVRTTEGPEEVEDPFDRVVVTGSVVNLRGGPGTGYVIVGRVERGDTLVVTGETAGWLRIYDESASLFAWIFRELTAPAERGNGEGGDRGGGSR